MFKQQCVYKMDSRGEIREWAIWTENNTIIIRHGVLNKRSSLVFDKVECESESDADIKAERRLTKQIERKGYTIAIPKSKPFRPMLCQRLQENMDKLPENVIYQPKLDGYRALGMNGNLVTRTNSPLPAFTHIRHTLSMLPDDIVLDGELYCHTSRFQQIMKSRSILPTADSYMIEYHTFDIVDENVTFNNRRMLLAEIIINLMDEYSKNPFVLHNKPLPFPIIPVKTTAGKSHELANYQAKFKAEGYEGTIVRLPEAKYEIDVRSYGLYKYKEVDSDMYVIKGVEPGPKDKRMGVLVCENKKGVLFRVNLKGSDTEKINMLKFPHVFINKIAIVEYFGLTDNGLPRNAVAVRVL